MTLVFNPTHQYGNYARFSPFASQAERAEIEKTIMDDYESIVPKEYRHQGRVQIIHQHADRTMLKQFGLVDEAAWTSYMTTIADEPPTFQFFDTIAWKWTPKRGE